MSHLIKIHNAQTGEVIEREMNDEELTQYEIDKARAQARAQAEAEAEAAKAIAEAKLAALGFNIRRLKSTRTRR
jgi:hypothetical protein